MIKPDELGSERPYGSWASRGCDVWDAICACIAGDVAALQRVLERDPNVALYNQPIHFAAREGHLEAVRRLLDAGADPDAEFNGDAPSTVARDRGHEQVARLLEGARSGRTRPADADHAIHIAVADGDLVRVRELLDADPQLIHLSDRSGGTPLHRAVAASERDVIALLLDRGADIHALHGNGPRSERGYAPVDFQAVDLALWNDPFWDVRGDIDTARLLLSRGATHDLVIAAALGDLERVQGCLDEDPARISEARPSGKPRSPRPWSSGTMTSSGCCSTAAPIRTGRTGRTRPADWRCTPPRAGDRPIVELLLAAGADPDSHLDSAGNATYVARTPELRAPLIRERRNARPLRSGLAGRRRRGGAPRGGRPRLGECRLRRSARGRFHSGQTRPAGPATGRRRAGAAGGQRLPLVPVQRTRNAAAAAGRRHGPRPAELAATTPLHDLCSRSSRGQPRPHRVECAKVLLDAGATISAKDEDYRSTPLAWAARHDLPDMVELLLARGATTNLADDEPWATPLAWATRRGHDRIAEILRAAGAMA